MRKILLAVAAALALGLAAPLATSTTADAQGYYGHQRSWGGYHGGYQSYGYSPRYFAPPRRHGGWHHHHWRPRHHHHHHHGW